MLSFSVALTFSIWLSCYGQGFEPRGDVGRIPTNGRASRVDSTPAELVRVEEEALKVHNDGLVSHPLPLHIPFHRFSFSHDDWAVISIPRSLRGNHQDQNMIVAQNLHPEKELQLSFSVPDYAVVQLTYKLYMARGEYSRVPPQLKVVLVSSDGTKEQLRVEEAKGKWQNSSLEIQTERESKILFVGILKSDTNEIAIRHVTTEKIYSLIPERYAASEFGIILRNTTTGGEGNLSDRKKAERVGETQMGNSDGKLSSDTQMGSGTKTIPGYLEDLEVNLTNHSPISTFDYYDDYPNSLNLSKPFLQTAKNNGSNTTPLNQNNTTALNQNNKTLSNGILDSEDSDYSFTSPKTERPISINKPFPTADLDTDSGTSTYNKAIPKVKVNNSSLNITGKISKISYRNDSGSLYDSVSLNSTSNSTNVVVPILNNVSNSKGVFNFFIVVIACSVLVLAFLYWRHTRRKSDDEIPVFNRGASEHGNPTYLDDDTEIDTGDQSNYRSFR